MKISSIALLLISNILNAQDNVSNAELSKKLDLLLGKLGGLEERVAKLESDNLEVKKEVKEVAKTAKRSKNRFFRFGDPPKWGEKEIFPK